MLSEELKQSMKKAALVAAVLAVICLPFHWQYSVGILLGLAFVSFDQLVLAIQLTSMLLNTQVNYIKFALIFFVRMAILGAPLALAVLYPSYSNVWATFVGMLLQKTFLYIQSFKSPKEGGDKNENHDSV